MQNLRAKRHIVQAVIVTNVLQGDQKEKSTRSNSFWSFEMMGRGPGGEFDSQDRDWFHTACQDVLHSCYLSLVWIERYEMSPGETSINYFLTDDLFSSVSYPV